MRTPATQTVGDNTFVDSRIVATGPRKLLAIVGYNNGVDRFVHIHNLAAVPANGIKPTFCISADGNRPFEFAVPFPVDMDAVTVVFSSTPQTTTITASADASIQGILVA